MKPFRIEIDKRNSKIVDMLQNYDECEHSFQRFFFTELLQMYSEITVLYEGRIAELDRRVLELEKELIFVNLPSEQCR